MCSRTAVTGMVWGSRQSNYFPSLVGWRPHGRLVLSLSRSGAVDLRWGDDVGVPCWDDRWRTGDATHFRIRFRPHWFGLSAHKSRCDANQKELKSRHILAKEAGTQGAF